MKNDPIKDKFTEIYRNNFWACAETRSGSGSQIEWCRAVMEALPKLLVELDVKTMLDLGCGDLNWMKHVELPLEKYIGVDIVKDLIIHLGYKYGNQQREFECLNAVKDVLPVADLILCKDVLVHLPFADGMRALSNMQESGAKYLLITDYPELEENHDIVLGDWRRLNLTKAPYYMAEPIRRIPTTIDNTYLSLWKLC